jgi:ribose/xylose/arabinose/galactoside ABC-type transport system permease subunit
MQSNVLWKKTRENGSTLVLILVLIAICALLASISPAFLTPGNLFLVVMRVALYGILAVGMTYVILGGGIDLSVGSVVALSSVVAAMLATGDFRYTPLWVPIVAAVATGAFCGLINGIAVAYAKVPAFIATLCMMLAARGVAMVATNAHPIFGMRPAFIAVSNHHLFRTFDEYGRIDFRGIPVLVLYFLGVMALGIILLHYTTYGRKVFAIGGNATVAKYSGINVTRIQCSTYIISGALAGLCGMLMASRISVGSPTTAEGAELSAIAAAVIGGISMSGGKGIMFGTFIGVLIIGVIGNGMDVLGVSPHWQMIFQGLIMFFAVFMDARINRKTL